MSNKKLIYIAGPTAVGKTALSVSVAQALQTEIISCDARQCYHEMTIGTGVPSQEEMKGIPHHFIQNKSIHQSFDAGAFEREGLKLLKKLFQKYDHVVMVGGSGLYAKALIEGLDKFPEITKKAVSRVKFLYQDQGLEGLQKLLKKIDPLYYKTVDLNNFSRLLRALEEWETVKKPYSSFLGKYKKKRPFSTHTLVLKMPRPQLYEKINFRVERMVEAGLEIEAQRLYSNKNLRALQTLGYREWFKHFEGEYSLKETIEEIKKNSRRYAKRQITWFNGLEAYEISMQIQIKGIKTGLNTVKNLALDLC
jgi:tRNA dimethylallyltransferase